MKRAKARHVHLELLDADFLIVQCGEKDILKTVKSIIAKDRFSEFEQQMSDNPIAPTTKGRTFWMGGGGSVIWFRDYDSFIILHECVHAVHHLLKDRNMPLTLENDELYAYLIAWLYKKAL